MTAKPLRLTLVLAVLLLAGCDLDLMSLHPLYTSADTLFDEALDGVWYMKDGDKVESIRFERVPETPPPPPPGAAPPAASAPVRKGYHVFGVDGEDKEEENPLRVHLVRVGGKLYFDITAKAVCDTCIRGHMFYRVELSRGTLRISDLSSKWLGEQLERGALPYETVRDGEKPIRVLRATTAQLQAFLSANAANPNAFGEWITLTRTRPNP